MISVKNKKMIPFYILQYITYLGVLIFLDYMIVVKWNNPINLLLIMFNILMLVIISCMVNMFIFFDNGYWERMMTIEVGDYVKHFKRVEDDSDDFNHIYKVLVIGANHTETGESLVIYQAMYGDNKVYARPFTMFFGKVDKGKYPNVKQELRLEKIIDEKMIKKLDEYDLKISSKK